MPKHVVVYYAENTLYSTNKYSCVGQVHTLYISYFIEHNGDDETHDEKSKFVFMIIEKHLIKRNRLAPDMAPLNDLSYV